MRSAHCFSILRTVRIGTTVTRFQIRLHFTLKCFTNAEFEENITEIQLQFFLFRQYILQIKIKENVVSSASEDDLSIH